MSNIFLAEARDIVNYLDRHGFVAKIERDVIVVDDPVYITNGVNSVRYEIAQTRLNGWPAAVQFVDERS